MDELDKKIVTLLTANARMTVKEIASRVALTSPAVSERIRRLERNNVIAGYTVRLSPAQERSSIRAFISIHVSPKDREEFKRLLQNESSVEEYFQVTGQQSYMVKVSCQDIPALDKLINRLQKMGPTNTQIILSSMRGPGILAEL